MMLSVLLFDFHRGPYRFEKLKFLNVVRIKLSNLRSKTTVSWLEKPFRPW